jgi:2,3-bisphosphoglycerate-dependent phosphoglycerate mutase
MSLILVRHGQSVWNLLNLFTGWVDVDLTDQGREEARKAGLILRYSGLVPHAVFVSPLKRASETGRLALETLGLSSLELQKKIEFVERYYGALTGLNKKDVEQKYGEEKVFEWRRSYKATPPSLSLDFNNSDDPRNASLFRDTPLRNTTTESLKDVVLRVEPVYREEILPLLNAGQTVLVFAHGNTNRALIKLALGLSDKEIESVDVPTGRPVIVTDTGWEFVSDLGLRRQQRLDETEYLEWARYITPHRGLG